MRTRLVCVLVAALAAASASVSAHHSYAAVYRVNERITIEGVLVTIVYRNPHSYLEVEARDGGGRVRLWSVECSSRIDLQRRSFTEGALKPGDRIIVSGDAARDSSLHRVRLRTLARPSDGWKWSEAQQ
jgi:uncharacterized protein DUF6152